MPLPDAFAQNILGVQDLIESGVNKVNDNGEAGEGVAGEYIDSLTLPMSDEELLNLRKDFLAKAEPYDASIRPRQIKNKIYYSGRQAASATQTTTVVSSNLIFEAEETFIPEALSKNPEPVVWSDNTNEGKEASNQVKTMLQYHADVLCLRKKLGIMVRHWSIYFIGVAKHGFNTKVNDISLDLRKPQNFLLDPDGYIDEYGNYIGDFLGERIESTAGALVELYPKHKNDIMLKVNDKPGTRVVRTEWWTDDYCFTTFEDWVLDKHKNEFFNYDVTDEEVDPETQEVTSTVTPGLNHFATPKMPYTFLSVFSLQETPHDITNLIEQSIPNQDRITERDAQISKNLRTGNNSIALSGQSFNSETAKQAAMALEDGDPVLVPDGQVDSAIKRIPASNLPSGILESQNIDKQTLRSVFGTAGLVPNNQPDVAVRNNILASSNDSSRIGGGIGDALEQVADNIFNWWLQLYCVFYDETHYGAIMGAGKAVEYVNLINSQLERKFVISVAPNSMQPKDEITEQNLAIDLANKGWLDPINLFKKLNYPDPMETAKMVTLFKLDPAMYFQMFFPEAAPQGVAPGLSPNPGDVPIPGAPQDQTLSNDPSSAALSQVPINNVGVPAA